MIRKRKLNYFIEQCGYYARKYGLEKEDLIAEAWLRIKENERKINKKYIQLRVECVAIDLRKAELKHQGLQDKLRMVEYMEKVEWVEQEKKN